MGNGEVRAPQSPHPTEPQYKLSTLQRTSICQLPRIPEGRELTYHFQMLAFPSELPELLMSCYDL